MAKFDPYDWLDMPVNALVAHPAGVVRVATNATAALYSVLPSNREVLIGLGNRWSIDMAEAGNIKLVTTAANPKAVIYIDRSSSFDYDTEEVWTNIDQMPVESGHQAEVTAALRRFEYEKRLMLAEMRSEFEQAQASGTRVAVPEVAFDIGTGEIVEEDVLPDPRLDEGNIA